MIKDRQILNSLSKRIIQKNILTFDVNNILRLGIQPWNCHRLYKKRSFYHRTIHGTDCKNALIQLNEQIETHFHPFLSSNKFFASTFYKTVQNKICVGKFVASFHIIIYITSEHDVYFLIEQKFPSQ